MPTALQLSDLRTRVRQNLNETSPSYWTDPEINNWLTDGYHQIVQSFHIVKNVAGTITANQQTFNIPVDYAETVAFFVDNNPVTLADPRLLASLGDYFTNPDLTKIDTGPPAAYFESGVDTNNNLIWWLYPLPDKTYNYILYYVIAATTMSGDTSVPQFRNDWHHILTYYATGMAWAKGKRSPSMAAYYMELWNREREEAVFWTVAARAENMITRYYDPHGPIRRNAQGDPLEIPGM